MTIDGEEYRLDAIICATGFDTSFKPAFPVIGVRGLDLATFWKDEPLHYMSIAAPGFPNYFSTSHDGGKQDKLASNQRCPVIGGPNSPISNGSLISGLEVEIDYAYECIEKMQTENIVALDVKEEAMEDFLEHRNESMKSYVWSGDCRSW